MKLYFSAEQARIKSKKAKPKDLLLAKIFDSITKECFKSNYSFTFPSKKVSKITSDQEVIDEVVEVLRELKYESYEDLPGIFVSWDKKD